MTKTIEKAAKTKALCICGNWAKRPESIRRVFGTRKHKGKEYVQTMCKKCRAPKN